MSSIDMDIECYNICESINKIPGIKTIESCCGHTKDKFHVWFDVTDLKNLPILLYYIDPCHVGFRWWCKVKTDCGMSPVRFYIESESTGHQAYKEAEVIAKKIDKFVSENPLCPI